MAHYDWNVKNVTQMTNAKQERAFKRVGAFIRSDARHSIRVSIRNSQPGDPPKAKSRKFKNSIVFAADAKGVVTGPVRAAPANSTPHILEASGWRTDSLGAIQARWDKANPQAARQQRKQWKAQSKNKGPNKRTYSQDELDHIRTYYQNKGQKTSPTSAQRKQAVHFFIARRPYIEPAFNKNKQKTLALLQ